MHWHLPCYTDFRTGAIISRRVRQLRKKNKMHNSLLSNLTSHSQSIIPFNSTVSAALVSDMFFLSRPYEQRQRGDFGHDEIDESAEDWHCARHAIIIII